MRTEEWLNTRVPRAAARIRRDVDEGNLGLGTLGHAMREIAEGSPAELEVGLLALALRGLDADQYRHLLIEANRALQGEAVRGSSRAICVLETWELDSSTEPRAGTPIRMGAGENRHNPLSYAILLQALLWAVSPPP
jgi:hypothetical protein